jgi:hypothetical protein
MSRLARTLAVVLVVVGAVACAGDSFASRDAPRRPKSPSSPGTGTLSATPPDQLIPDCEGDRLPNLVLSEGIPAPDGVQALGPVTGPTDGVIGFDQALIRACEEDGYRNATTVQVVLGSADPKARHWDAAARLFYGVAWGGMKQCSIGGILLLTPQCSTVTAGTILDAFTGAFIVGGS